MYAVTAGSANSVNSVSTSETAISRSVVSSPRSGGTRSLHCLRIGCRILTDGGTETEAALRLCRQARYGRAYTRGVRTRKPWVVAVVVLFTVFALIVFVLASATVGVPSEISLPLLVLAAIAFRSVKNRRARVAG